VADALACAGVLVRPYGDATAALQACVDGGAKVVADPAKVLALDGWFVASRGWAPCGGVLLMHAPIGNSRGRGLVPGRAFFSPPPRRRRQRRPQVNFALWSRVPPGNRAPVTPAPLCAAKAVKNGAELLGMRRAHARDGAAVVEFLAGLFDEVGAKRPRGFGRALVSHARVCECVRASV
jgi:hypothetical protein